MAKCSVNICSATGIRSQGRCHAYFTACLLAGSLDHMDLHIPVNGARGKTGIPSSFFNLLLSFYFLGSKVIFPERLFVWKWLVMSANDFANVTANYEPFHQLGMNILPVAHNYLQMGNVTDTVIYSWNTAWTTKLVQTFCHSSYSSYENTGEFVTVTTISWANNLACMG